MVECCHTGLAWAFHNYFYCNMLSWRCFWLNLPLLYFLSLRLFADILNDTSILVEMLAPLFKAYFTILACLSSISKVYFKMLVGMSNPDEKISYFLLAYFHQGSSFLDKIWKKEGFSLWEKVLECSTSMPFFNSCFLSQSLQVWGKVAS